MELYSTYIETDKFDELVDFYEKVFQKKGNVYTPNRWTEFDFGNKLSIYNKLYDKEKIESGEFKENYNTAYIDNFNAERKEAIEKYLEVRKEIQPKNKKDNDILFLSNKKCKFSSRGIENAIDRAYDKTGLDSKVYTVHTLRHTCATLLYKAGIDIKTIQEILGHVQIDTTEIYTHLHDEEVMNAMFEHPLSKFKMANAQQFCEMAS